MKIISTSGRPLPPGWTEIPSDFFHGTFKNEKRGLAVIYSIAPYSDGKTWLHVSVSHRGRIPTYEELMYVKRNWIGDDKKAIQVFPKRVEHVNIHPRCLHLFCCMDGDPLPDFTDGKGSL